MGLQLGRAAGRPARRRSPSTARPRRWPAGSPRPPGPSSRPRSGAGPPTRRQGPPAPPGSPSSSNSARSASNASASRSDSSYEASASANGVVSADATAAALAGPAFPQRQVRAGEGTGKELAAGAGVAWVGRHLEDAHLNLLGRRGPYRGADLRSRPGGRHDLRHSSPGASSSAASAPRPSVCRWRVVVALPGPAARWSAWRPPGRSRRPRWSSRPPVLSARSRRTRSPPTSVHARTTIVIQASSSLMGGSVRGQRRHRVYGAVACGDDPHHGGDDGPQQAGLAQAAGEPRAAATIDSSGWLGAMPSSAWSGLR